jgi:hypothetical protein
MNNEAMSAATQVAVKRNSLKRAGNVLSRKARTAETEMPKSRPIKPGRVDIVAKV